MHLTFSDWVCSALRGARRARERRKQRHTFKCGSINAVNPVSINKLYQARKSVALTLCHLSSCTPVTPMLDRISQINVVCHHALSVHKNINRKIPKIVIRVRATVLKTLNKYSNLLREKSVL